LALQQALWRDSEANPADVLISVVAALTPAVQGPFVMLARPAIANNIYRSSPLPPSRVAGEDFPMGTRCRLFLGAAAAVSLFAGVVGAQDSQSLGDLARQQRQQKEQSKTVPGKDAKAPKVITNEEIPEHEGPAPALAADGEESRASMPAPAGGPKQPPEHVKSQILTQKHQIASLQRQVDEINESIRFAPANCAANCVGWNERQREKQQQVERMQAQLEEEKKRLEDMQESARKQGFGNSVYDP
jgi:hypothetical protein